MGKDGSGAGAQGSLRPVKPPPGRLYGRARGHTLRPRQETLLRTTLPRLRFPERDIATPLAAFGDGYAALWLEVGFGAGEHALALARSHPGAALIACEVFENGICSLLSALVPEGAEATAPLPANLRLWTDDARTLLSGLPDTCLDRLFLLFPDPWPKARHAKRRFIHPAILQTLARVMKPGAEWRIASDDPTYQAWVDKIMASQTLFIPLSASAARPDGWPPTRYEAKALRAGRRPLYWVFGLRG